MSPKIKTFLPVFFSGTAKDTYIIFTANIFTSFLAFLYTIFLARAFAGEPKMLILDEPEVGIDIAGQEEFYTFLDKLNQESGLTIIFVSHDIELISHSVKSVLCLNRRLLCHGSPREFIKEEYIDQLYGKKVKFIFHEHTK